MFFVALAKVKLKIENNVKKVLQNGCKYTQDSTTLLFSIDFIHLNALKFPKIVKNYYGAPPPPEPTTRQNSFFDLLCLQNRLQYHLQNHLKRRFYRLYRLYRLCSVVVEPSH